MKTKETDLGKSHMTDTSEQPIKADTTTSSNDTASLPLQDAHHNVELKRCQSDPFVSGLDNKPFDLPISEGDVLGGRYRIIREIGKGVGTVYQAYDPQRGFDVALKIIVSAPEQAPAAEQQLQQELRARRKITDFTHIIKTYDTHTINYEGLCLVLLSMEYADGGSMRSWLNQHKSDSGIRRSEGLELFKQTCLGVKTIHNAGLIHSDIKPENILLCRTGDKLIAKISDFGISRKLTYSSKDILPEIRLGYGDPHYISPEQFYAAREKDIGCFSDIYSLGVIFFELFDGALPFEGSPDELKDKHLNMQPPQLAADLKSWMPIVERCLAKSSTDRYDTVEQLTRDINNMQRGFSVSIDVACPACESINSDPKKTYCESCNHVLPSSFFRPCPRCIGPVRLDQEDCPHDGKQGVAAYYLLEERKEKIEKLKDVDPVATIKLLEIVLREGTGDFEGRAEELIRDLRQKQPLIVPLIEKARKATDAGFPEKAIEAWQEVRKIIPRHWMAEEHIRKLKSLIDKFNHHWEKAIKLMDEAKFDEADKFLDNCLELVPTREEVRELFASRHERSKKYVSAFREALATTESGALIKASRLAKDALLQAPQSHETKNLLEIIKNKQEKAHKLFKEAQIAIRAARFDNAHALLNQIKTLWPTMSELENIKRRLAKTQADYEKHMQKASQTYSGKHLTTALQFAESALGICPDSAKAKQTIQIIKRDQSNAHAHLDNARRLLSEAEFNEARKQIKQAAELWPTLEGLEDTKTEIDFVEKSFNEALDSSQRNLGKRNFTEAAFSCATALEFCCNSVQAQSLRREIKCEKYAAEQRRLKRKQALRKGFSVFVTVMCLPFLCIFKGILFISKGLLFIPKGLLCIWQSFICVCRGIGYLCKSIIFICKKTKWAWLTVLGITVAGAIVLGAIFAFGWIVANPYLFLMLFVVLPLFWGSLGKGVEDCKRNRRR